jgi:hypothetical protein
MLPGDADPPHPDVRPAGCFDLRVQDSRPALIGTLALLAATVAALFALALAEHETSSAVPDRATPAPSQLDPERLLELGVESTPSTARGVEDIRRLEFRRVPRPEISDTERLRRLTERQLAKPAVERQLKVGEAELRLLGLLDPADSLGEVAGDVSALALAYYDPRRDELFLVGDAVPAGPELAEFVLAHELTHALEDQRFGLPLSTGLSDDRTLAETALIEGTASVVMERYAQRFLDPLALAAEAASLDSGASGDLPRFAEAEVTFSYLDGARFVEDLITLGTGWTLVDYAYQRRMPATTEQILHPEKYVDDERPIRVAPPHSPGPGWRALDTGTLGEFGTREVLAEGEPGLGADLGADGWGGDRYRLFARAGAPAACAGDCRSTHALGIAWRSDDEANARELTRQLVAYVEVGLGGQAVGADVWRLDGGWAALSASEDRVRLGLAPTPAIARDLATAR